MAKREQPSCEIRVRVTPRSSQNKIELQPDGSLKIWVTAAPTDGQANEAVIAQLASRIRIAKSRITIESGQSNREKRVAVSGLSEGELQIRLSKSK